VNPSSLPSARDRGRLLAWVNRQKSAPLSAPQAAALDALYPEWRTTTHNGAWYTKLDAVEAFVSENGKFPRAKSDDPDEKAAGIWLATQRQRVGIMTLKRRKVLDERLPGWDRPFDRDHEWSEKLTYVVAFEAEHGRPPSNKSKDPREAKAGAWFQHQKAGTGMTPDREAALDRAIPAWRETKHDHWMRSLARVQTFYRTHGRRPDPHATDPAERSLGSWYWNAMNRAQSTERTDALTKADLGTRRTQEALWQEKLELCAQFVRDHGRYPAFGKESHPDERRLGSWLGEQRRLGAKLKPSRRLVLDETLADWAAPRSAPGRAGRPAAGFSAAA
jgi:hypothetical protein